MFTASFGRMQELCGQILFREDAERPLPPRTVTDAEDRRIRIHRCGKEFEALSSFTRRLRRLSGHRERLHSAR